MCKPKWWSKGIVRRPPCAPVAAAGPLCAAGVLLVIAVLLLAGGTLVALCSRRSLGARAGKGLVLLLALTALAITAAVLVTEP